MALLDVLVDERVRREVSRRDFCFFVLACFCRCKICALLSLISLLLCF